MDLVAVLQCAVIQTIILCELWVLVESQEKRSGSDWVMKGITNWEIYTTFSYQSRICLQDCYTGKKK